jgi:type II secretion system protein N
MKERLRERLVAIAAAVGYPLFYVFCLVLFASWTFPWERIRQRAVSYLNEEMRSPNASWEWAIDDISSSFITGVKMTDLHATERDGSKETKSDPAPKVKVDSLVARIEVLPLLIGNHDLDLHAELFGGKLDAFFKDQSKGQALDVTLEAIDLGQTPLGQMLEAPVEGLLGGTIKLEMPDGRFAKANGSVALEATDLALGDGKAKLAGKLAVPRLSLGTFSLTADVKDGTMKVSKLGASGKDVDFLADARVTLHEQLMESFADINFRFRVSDSYRGKSDSTKALFGAPGSSVPGVLELDPKMKQSKRADGFFVWHARGLLSRLEPSPGGTGGPTSGPGGNGGGAPSKELPMPRGKGSL